jgi:hypothetical protein
MTDHPITPPPELLQEWCQQGRNCISELDALKELATQAARWGSDQELEACCEWLHWQNLATHSELIPSLRIARRPKPPSLKEQALEALNEAAWMADDIPPEGISPRHVDIIRRALEQLDD